MKIALGLEYLGYNYLGWQRQDISPTIQETLETALSEIANETISVVCAGRTDRGVHAIQQVVHFETNAERETHSWLLGSNTKLPGDIAVKWVKQVDDDFHARFSAKARTYQYLIINQRARPAILNKIATWECQPLELERMQEAADCLIGEHDFTSYRAVACQAKSPIRCVDKLDIVKKDNLFIMTISANAFLHHMVRNIAGVLMAIGMNKAEVAWAGEVLAAKDRTAAGVTASPHGLYLLDVKYPSEFEIPTATSLLEKLRLL